MTLSPLSRFICCGFTGVCPNPLKNARAARAPPNVHGTAIMFELLPVAVWLIGVATYPTGVV